MITTKQDGLPCVLMAIILITLLATGCGGTGSSGTTVDKLEEYTEQLEEIRIETDKLFEDGNIEVDEALSIFEGFNHRIVIIIDELEVLKSSSDVIDAGDESNIKLAMTSIVQYAELMAGFYSFLVANRTGVLFNGTLPDGITIEESPYRFELNGELVCADDVIYEYVMSISDKSLAADEYLQSAQNPPITE